MAEETARQSSRLQRTVCLPISEVRYRQIIEHPQEFRRALNDCFQQMPELFPPHFAEGLIPKSGANATITG